MPAERPSVQMSHEEHSSISALTQTVVQQGANLENLSRTVERFAVAVERQMGETRGDVRALTEKLAERSQFKWGSAISMLVGVLTILGAGGYILRLQAENAAIPTNTAVVQVAESLRQVADREKQDIVLLNDLRRDLDANNNRDAVSERDRASLNARADRTDARLDAGKDARLEEKREQQVKNAVQDERIAELFFRLNGHYPR